MRNVTLAFILLALAACTGAPQRDEPPAVSGRFTHPRFGWSIDVPVGFVAFPIGVDSLRGETGVLVSNFEVEEPGSLAEFRDFPSEGAALRIWSLESDIEAAARAVAEGRVEPAKPIFF